MLSFKGLLYFKFLLKCLATDFSVLWQHFFFLVSVIHLLISFTDLFPLIFHYCVFALIPCHSLLFYVPLNELGFPGPPISKFPCGILDRPEQNSILVAFLFLCFGNMTYL